MQTLKQGFEERNLIMGKMAEELAQSWRSRLESDCPEQSSVCRESIVRWLLGSDLERYEQLNAQEMAIAQQAMEYRYRILRQRYLGIGPERAYRNLTTRLGSLVLLRNKIRTWVALSRDRQRTVLEVLQEVLQELLQSDRYMQQQTQWIAQCTTDARLRNSLVLASTEEYCLRPVRNQPLLVYRFVNYLRRSQRGGLTQVPSNDLVRLVSEEILTEDSDNPVNLLDDQAIAEYQAEQAALEQQVLRNNVKQEFEAYLHEQLGEVAVQWLHLYLQGKAQDAIARHLKVPIKQVYRLREKISYHAVRVFAIKGQPELVGNWLEISLQEHKLGLTTQQWQQFYDQLTPTHRQIIDLLLLNHSFEAIGKQIKLKTHQVLGEWSKIYLIAQSLRNDEESENQK